MNRTVIAAALRDQEFEKALELLSPALQESPQDAQLWTMQGVAYVGEKQQKEALASFRRALQLAPDYLPALQGAAQIEYDASSPEAIPLIQHVLRLRPADQTGHGMLAVLEYQQGRWDAAVREFEKTGTLFDSRPTALHAYAICLVKLKQFDRAANVLQRTVSLNSTDQRERQVLAAIQLMANKPADALATLEPFLQTNNPGAETLELASRAYDGSRETSQAVSMLRQAILLAPQNINLYLDFANISYRHGSFQVGVDVISDGLALQPKAAPLYFARGVLYVQLAQYDKAEADFQKAYELDPNQSLSSAAQGLAAAQANDFERALEKVRASLARKPNDAFMLYLQADILAAQNAEPGTADFQLALRSARKAIALQPTLEPARGVLAKLYLEAGHYQEAAEECRKALQSNPKDQAAVYHLIRALRKTGNVGEIPDLLKRLALLRRQEAKEESDRYQYQLVEEDAPH
ncbi:MAG TPA: tetratricopeptide repeat protein [Terriglobales bacterium]|nr:tetratricopeptide repeat protein [Terriglobales bacterium]